MIEAIHERLLRWADWVSRGRYIHGLGYPRCTFDRTPSSGCVDPLLDEEATATDRAVRLLPSELRQVVQTFYTKRGTVQQKAYQCRIHRDTLYERLHQSHDRLEQIFSSAAKSRRAWPCGSIFS